MRWNNKEMKSEMWDEEWDEGGRVKGVETKKNILKHILVWNFSNSIKFWKLENVCRYPRMYRPTPKSPVESLRSWDGATKNAFVCVLCSHILAITFGIDTNTKYFTTPTSFLKTENITFVIKILSLFLPTYPQWTFSSTQPRMEFLLVKVRKVRNNDRTWN